MLSDLERLVRTARDYPAKRLIALNENVLIAPSAMVQSYRNLHLQPGSRLQIGQETIMEGYVTTEHPDAIVTIGSRTFVGGSRLISARRIIIGDDVLVSWGCTIVDHDSHSISWSKRADDVADWARKRKNWEHVGMGFIDIKDKVWIGANVTILKNTTLGEGAVVGTGSVVTKDVPAWTVVAGNPAKVIRLISENER